jgi:hypothetical protein
MNLVSAAMMEEIIAGWMRTIVKFDRKETAEALWSLVSFVNATAS